MCKIIFLLIVTSISISEASLQTLKASFSYEKVDPSPFDDAYSSAPAQKFLLSYSIEELKKYWGLNVGINQINRDFSRTVIKNKYGVEKTISDAFPESESETSALVGIFFSKTPLSIGLNFGSTVSKTPFSFQSFNFSGQYSFNNLNSILGFDLGKKIIKSPKNYFTRQVDFKKIHYPINQGKEKAHLFMESIWNERFKTKLSFSYFWEDELIRSSRGGSLSMGYSFSESLFGLFKIEQAESVKERTPLDNNGHFLFNSLLGQISYDVNFEWTVFANYTLMREVRETKEVSQQASDEYILGFKHIWTEKNLSQSWQISHIRGNLKERSISVQGKIEWNII